MYMKGWKMKMGVRIRDMGEVTMRHEMWKCQHELFCNLHNAILEMNNYDESVEY